MASGTKALDYRRKRWESFRGKHNQEPLLKVLQRNMDERPASRYELDETVFVPKLGIRGITDKYYRSGSGWHYTFYTRNGLHTYKEKQLLPKGEALLLQDVMNIIRAGG